MTDTFKAFRIHHDGKEHHAGIEYVKLDDLKPGELVVEAAWSSVNYKDALAGRGKAPILRTSPLVGGIDAAGKVIESSDERFKPGDRVLVTGCGLSETRDGGFSETLRLQADWAIPLPEGLNLREAHGSFRLHWIDLAKGDWGKQETVSGGKVVQLAAPGKGNWVAALVRN